MAFSTTKARQNIPLAITKSMQDTQKVALHEIVVLHKKLSLYEEVALQQTMRLGDSGAGKM